MMCKNCGIENVIQALTDYKATYIKHTNELAKCERMKQNLENILEITYCERAYNTMHQLRSAPFDDCECSNCVDARNAKQVLSIPPDECLAELLKPTLEVIQEAKEFSLLPGTNIPMRLAALQTKCFEEELRLTTLMKETK